MALSVITGGFSVIYVCIIRPIPRLSFRLMIFFHTARTILRNRPVLMVNILSLVEALSECLSC